MLKRGLERMWRNCHSRDCIVCSSCGHATSRHAYMSAAVRATREAKVNSPMHVDGLRAGYAAFKAVDSLMKTFRVFFRI